MNASLLTAELDAQLAPKPRAEAFGKGLLLVNALVLGATGLIQSQSDLAGSFLGLGPMGSYLEGKVDTVGFFEAHMLAFILAVLILVHRKTDGAAWNWVAAGTHLMLGSANIMFWGIFVDAGQLPLGVIATTAHGIFFVLQLIAALARSPAVLGGPGALFRASAAITIFTGVALHVSRLPLGPEVFQTQVFTPLVDAIFAVPMTIAGVTGLLLWKRAILPTLWEKVAYGFVVIFLAGSVVLHAKTLFSWDTSYVNSFPAFYPLVATIYLSLIGWFAVTRRFEPAGRA